MLPGQRYSGNVPDGITQGAEITQRVRGQTIFASGEMRRVPMSISSGRPMVGASAVHFHLSAVDGALPRVCAKVRLVLERR